MQMWALKRGTPDLSRQVENYGTANTKSMWKIEWLIVFTYFAVPEKNKTPKRLFDHFACESKVQTEFPA